MFEMISKVLTANDVGTTGGHQAGITIPRSEEMLNFFPRLDSNVINPSTEVRCFVHDGREPIVLRYIYYNGKLHGTSTRNEYRLTGLTKFFRDHEAATGDELIFRRESSNQFLIQIKKSSLNETTEESHVGSTKIKLTGKWSSYKVRKS